MKLRTTTFLGATLLVVASCASGDEELQCHWLRWAPPAQVTEEWSDLPRSDLYEVVASMHAFATRELESAVVIPLTIERARMFNDRYEAAPGKQPYLVRAVYGHAGAGVYGVLRHGDDLRVSHSSLGRTSVCNESALVVNLDFEPREVYIEVHIAE